MTETEASAGGVQTYTDAEQTSAWLGEDSKGKRLVSAFTLERWAAARKIPCSYLGFGKRRRLAFSPSNRAALAEMFSSDPANYGRT